MAGSPSSRRSPRLQIAGLGHDALEHMLGIEELEKLKGNVLQELTGNELRNIKGAILTKLMGDILGKLTGDI